jgi:hypothetical protein
MPQQSHLNSLTSTVFMMDGDREVPGTRMAWADVVADNDEDVAPVVRQCLLCDAPTAQCSCPVGVGKWRWAAVLDEPGGDMRAWYRYCDWRIFQCSMYPVDFTWCLPQHDEDLGGWYGSDAGRCSLALPCGFCFICRPLVDQLDMWRHLPTGQGPYGR